MEGVPAFLTCERTAPVAVREGLAKHPPSLFDSTAISVLYKDKGTKIAIVLNIMSEY